MIPRVKTLSHFSFLGCRIYLLFLAVLFFCPFTNPLIAQELNSFKTISSGNYSNPAIWRTFNGTVWVVTLSKPGSVNDIYIDQTHLVTLTGNEQAKSVFINAETGANQKLNLAGFALDIFGSLNAFSGPAPGTPSGTWNSQNWIGNSIGSRIVFRGISRTIIKKNNWSGFTTNSRYAVIFDPGPGQELTIEEPFKSLQFTIRSGTVLQKLDTSVNPAACASLSFNTETTVFGIGPFGNLIIENGGTLVSQCNAGIMFRSGSGGVSAALFDLQAGGELILEGQNPKIEAANFQLNGKIIFRSGTSPKTFLTSSFSDASIPTRVTNLELQGNQNLSLPSTFYVQGDLSQVGTGAILTSSIDLHFEGSLQQRIQGFSLTARNLTMNKLGGKVTLEQSLSVTHTFNQIKGILNFQENKLFLNNSTLGGLNYVSGSWENLTELNYYAVPATLNATNASFPFADRYQKGIRTVQLIGNTNRENLQIKFTEYLGAEYNSGFNDSDGTPILYRLFSYFSFFGMSANSNPLELRISAANLIVDQVDDLRIVATGYAAPGNHLPGLDPSLLWARRSLTFSQLEGINFTVGSYRTLSVLPVKWLSFEGKRISKKLVLSWKLATEVETREFEIFKSENGLNGWISIGKVFKSENPQTPFFYEFKHPDHNPAQNLYFKIQQIDFSDKSNWSSVILIKGVISETFKIQISPNPYQGGPLEISFPTDKSCEEQEISVFDLNGKIFFIGSFQCEVLKDNLATLPSGIYLVRFGDSNSSQTFRWVVL